MTAARHAEPGERYIIFGHPHAGCNGQTGLCLHVEKGRRITNHTDFTPERPLMAILPDKVLPGILPLRREAYYVLPRKWLYALDDGEQRDDEEPVSRELIEETWT